MCIFYIYLLTFICVNENEHILHINTGILKPIMNKLFVDQVFVKHMLYLRVVLSIKDFHRIRMWLFVLVVLFWGWGKHYSSIPMLLPLVSPPSLFSFKVCETTAVSPLQKHCICIRSLTLFYHLFGIIYFPSTTDF